MTDETQELCNACGESIDEQIAGLKSALEKTRSERDDWKAKSKATEGKQERAELEQQLEAATQERNEALQALDDARTKNEAMVAELSEAKQTAETLQTENVTARAEAAIAEAGGKVAVIKPHVTAKLRDNPDADPRDIVAALRADEDFADSFRASTHSGGGTDPGTMGGRGPAEVAAATLRRSTMTDRQKIDFQNAHGLDALLDLPE